MTALTLPAQPGPDGRPRPVPWRRMAWVTWRQHRLAVAGVVAALGAVAVYLYITGEQLRHQSFISYGAGPVLSITAVLFQAIPPLIGAFVGAPVLARELETGTFRFTWTQGFGRARWTVATLAPLALAVTAAAGAFGFLFSWSYGPQINGNPILSPLAATTFDLHEVALAAWTLAAFAIGAVAGVLIRRVVPAMFATLVAWSGLAIVTGAFLRLALRGAVGHQELQPARWCLDREPALDPGRQAGQPLHRRPGAAEDRRNGGRARPLGPGPRGGRPIRAGARPGKRESGAISPAPRHYATDDVPAGSRFWPFQWIEGGWLLALSLLLLTAAVWLVHRRAA